MTESDPTPEIQLRPMEPQDAEAVAELALQLGYARPLAAVRRSIEELCESPERVAFVACRDAQVIGWIEASVQRRLQSEPYTLIGGLVVSERLRGQGIGRLLCRRAEQWSWDHGMRTVRVTSRSSRVEAHRFYREGGYREIKTSAVFEKTQPD